MLSEYFLLICFALSCCALIFCVAYSYGTTASIKSSVTNAGSDIGTLSKRALFINLKRQEKRRRHITKLLTDMGFHPEHVEPAPVQPGWKSLV